MAANFGFISIWIGRDLFGGVPLTAMLAIDVLVFSIAHGLVVPLAVLGRRLSVGLLTLANGVVHIALALVLGRALGLIGVAAAAALSALVTTIPGGAILLKQVTALTERKILMSVAFPAIARIAPCFLAAFAAASAFARPTATERLGARGAQFGSLFAGMLIGVGYLFIMRPLLRALPLNARMRRIFAAVRLV